MRRVRKGPAPAKLVSLMNSNPSANWDVVRSNKSRYAQIRRQLFTDQQSLCAYCEIRMIMDEDDLASSDFRVEHFHPKSPHAPPPNYAAMWSNLLGCCHGGSQKAVTAQGRFTAPDLSCDALKGDQNLVGVILDPTIDIDGTDSIFKFSTDGSVSVSDVCPGSLSVAAGQTINLLGLDTVRLRRLRRAAVEAVLEAISTLSDDGVELEQACEVAFPSDVPPEFYSCIRYILGAAAEQRLRSLNYYQ